MACYKALMCDGQVRNMNVSKEQGRELGEGRVVVEQIW